MQNRKGRQDSESLNILRLIVLLRALTRCHGNVGRSELMSCLHDHNLTVTPRQLQRDLLFLERYFLLDGRTTRSGKKLWTWNAGCWWSEMDDEAGQAGCLGSFLQRGRLPLRSSLRSLPPSAPIESRMLRLARILSLVELLPAEVDNAWISVAGLTERLSTLGFNPGKRTVQRDMSFVRKHFLVVERNAGGNGKEWQRLEDGDWESSFEPRCPTTFECDHPLVNAFLFGAVRTSRNSVRTSAR